MELVSAPAGPSLVPLTEPAPRQHLAASFGILDKQSFASPSGRQASKFSAIAFGLATPMAPGPALRAGVHWITHTCNNHCASRVHAGHIEL